MGKNNRQRRAHKHQARQKAEGGRVRDASGRSWYDSGGGRADLQMLLLEAGCTAEHGTPEECAEAVEQITVCARRGGSVDRTVMTVLVYALREAWEGGWQPVDVLRAVSRRFDAGAVEVARSAILYESQTAGAGVAMPEEWSAQLEQLRGPGAGLPVWDVFEEVMPCVRVLGLLTHLPVLPCLLPPPSQWGRDRLAGSRTAPQGVDGRMLAKVRALLAKAESTNFEEEAESLTAKAQELMARYALDQAMVAGASSEEAPLGRRIGVDDPYADAKSRLLSQVAGANRCQSVWSAELRFATVIGFTADLEVVEVLYTSLLVQATRAMTRAGSVHDQSGRSRTRSYRQSFLVSFACRIGERLREASTRATEEAGVVHGQALLPVLAARGSEVDEAVAAIFPELVSSTARVSNWDGWVAGRVAADHAHLGPEQQRLDAVAI